MRYRILLAGAAIALGVGLTASPASAADTGVTFTVTTAGLEITVPASISLGSGAAGTTVSSLMGTVTVTDGRAAAVASWTATVSSTAFTTPGPPVETIPNANVSYLSGAATVGPVGSGTFTPGQTTTPVALGAPATAFTHVGGSGNNSVGWNPTLSVAIPADAVGGLYSGTVTHSAA